MADTQTRPAKVVTAHDGASAAIDSLRDVAGTLGELGNQVIDLTHTVDRLEAEADEESLYVGQMEAEGTEEAAQLRQAIADFDRGIIDQAELVRLGREV